MNMSTLKTFAEDVLYLAQVMKFVFKGVEKIVGK